MNVLFFKTYIFSKVLRRCSFQILLHHATKILDKTMLNQENSLVAVNIFSLNEEAWMFASSSKKLKTKQ
jgi:hypothetical protein